MTGALSVSLVIVSHSRPESLARLLNCLSHQTLRCFQTIVVTDAPACLVGSAEHVPFTQRNISAARNAGIARAQGEVVAFCDDDAVPEPAWLVRLIAPFSNPRVGAAGGYVRNRNGIAFQSRAVAIDMCGRDTPVDVDASAPWSCPVLPEGHVIKTVGTNCAFRRSALLEAEGFDTAMRYYLEEADLNIRLAAAGWLAAVVPVAEVHHGLHASPIRSARGVPADLFEIGASLAYFLGRHCAAERIEQRVEEFRAQRKARLQHFRAKGMLSKRRVRLLLQQLENGFAEGARRNHAENPESFLGKNRIFRPVPVKSSSRRIALLARPFRRRIARNLARRLATEGHDVTLIDFRPGVRFLTVRYVSAGYWLHRGGSFGRGDREDPLLRAASVRQRCREELRRIAGQRVFDTVHEITAWTTRRSQSAFWPEHPVAGQPVLAPS